MDKKRILGLVKEMGEERMGKYIDVYIKMIRNHSKEDFFKKFTEYLDECEVKSKNGTPMISLFGFKRFLFKVEFPFVKFD